MRRLMKDEEFEPEMPFVPAAGYMLVYLFEVGPTMLSGMGEVPLTHTELAAWQMNTGVELTSWEARTLLRLSREYMAQGQKATKPDCKAPWMSPGAEEKRVVAFNMRNSISQLVKL